MISLRRNLVQRNFILRSPISRLPEIGELRPWADLFRSVHPALKIQALLLAYPNPRIHEIIHRLSRDHDLGRVSRQDFQGLMKDSWAQELSPFFKHLQSQDIFEFTSMVSMNEEWLDRIFFRLLHRQEGYVLHPNLPRYQSNPDFHGQLVLTRVPPMGPVESLSDRKDYAVPRGTPPGALKLKVKNTFIYSDAETYEFCVSDTEIELEARTKIRSDPALEQMQTHLDLLKQRPWDKELGLEAFIHGLKYCKFHAPVALENHSTLDHYKSSNQETILEIASKLPRGLCLDKLQAQAIRGA